MWRIRRFSREAEPLGKAYVGGIYSAIISSIAALTSCGEVNCLIAYGIDSADLFVIF